MCSVLTDSSRQTEPRPSKKGKGNKGKALGRTDELSQQLDKGEITMDKIPRAPTPSNKTLGHADKLSKQLNEGQITLENIPEGPCEYFMDESKLSTTVSLGSGIGHGACALCFFLDTWV